MQVTENVSDGLKREFDVKVPAAALEARVVERLGELKDRVRINGFRPGKVPLAHLKKLYGRSVMAETIETVVRETNAKIVDERGLKLAMEPKVTMPQEAVEVEKVLEGKSDLAYRLDARGAAEDRARRFRQHQARAAGGRGDRARDRRGGAEGRRGQQALQPQGRGRRRSRTAIAS